MNLLNSITEDLTDERFVDLLTTDAFRVERIVSHGQRSPNGFWYDQPQAEWVLVLTGAARLRFEDADDLLEMSAGDYVNIAAHRRHRVEWTDPGQHTVWLVIHYQNATHKCGTPAT